MEKESSVSEHGFDFLRVDSFPLKKGVIKSWFVLDLPVLLKEYELALELIIFLKGECIDLD